VNAAPQLAAAPSHFHGEDPRARRLQGLNLDLNNSDGDAMKKHVLMGAAAAVVALATAAVPSTAEAQVRATGLVGVDWYNRAPTALSLRVEGTFSLIPWIHLGAYGAALSALDDSTTGYSVGGLVALRPGIPGTSVDPMGFASIGYQRTPGDVWDSGAVLQLGGGLVIHTLPFLDLELRAAYVQMVASNDDSSGFTAAAGISIHP